LHFEKLSSSSSSNKGANSVIEQYRIASNVASFDYSLINVVR